MVSLRMIAFILISGLLATAAGAAEIPSDDGVTISYDVRGQGEPALIFVHGWSCDRTYWELQVDEFTDTHTVVTLDLAGHGTSGLGRKEWTISAYARDVAAVVKALNLPHVILIGHSMSGPICVEAATLMPKLVVGVIGVDTLHDMGQSYSAEQVEMFITPMREDFKTSAEMFVRSMFPANADPALVDRIAKDMAAAPPDVAISTISAVLKHSMIPVLAKLEAPIRCINSEIWPHNLEGNRALYPDFDVITLADTGHFLFAEKPDDFNGKLAEIIRGLEQ